MPVNLHPSVNTDPHNAESDTSTILPRWLVRICRPKRMLWLAPLIGFVLCVPFLFSGYSADDHIFRQQTLEKTSFIKQPAWNYFNWVSKDSETAYYRERGTMVYWWTPDGFRFHMFRPLASVVHAFQFRFFGNSPWVMHLGLGALYALLIFLCARILTGISSSPAALGIAILLFAIDDTHSYSAGWISAYNTMLCCVFGYFALLMHIRWRRSKSTGRLLLFISAFVLALLSSEGGLALMGYLFAYVLFMEDGTWRKKAVSLVPGTVIAGTYLLYYSIQELGAKLSFGYISPGDDLVRTMYLIISNTVMLVVSQILSFPPFSAVIQLSAGGWGILVSAVLLVFIAIIFRKFIASTRTVAFFCSGMIITIIPFTIGMASDRSLIWAGIGAAGLLGELFTVTTAASGKLQRIFAKTLLFTNAALSLICFIPLPFVMFSMDSGARALEKTITAENTIVLNDPGALAFFWGSAIRHEKGGDWPEHCYSLYTGTDTVTIKRTGERTLLSISPDGWWSSYFDKSTRPKQLAFKKGEKIDLQLMTATFEEVTSDGRPVRVNFTFKKDISEFVWIKWAANQPMKCEVPAIGKEIRLAASMF